MTEELDVILKSGLPSAPGDVLFPVVSFMDELVTVKLAEVESSLG